LENAESADNVCVGGAHNHEFWWWRLFRIQNRLSMVSEVGTRVAVHLVAVALLSHCSQQLWM